MNVTVIGTGYVGLVTGAIFSNQGHDVTCVDTNKKKIEDLWNGILPIYEPGLEEVVNDGIRMGCLRFTTDAADAVKDADIVFLAVGTPQSQDGAANLDYLTAADIASDRLSRSGQVIQVRRTVLTLWCADSQEYDICVLHCVCRVGRESKAAHSDTIVDDFF